MESFMKTWVRRFGGILSAITLISGTAACDDDDILLTILPHDGTASSSEPAELTVTAVNRGDSRVVWGKGSSSCQLSAVVRVGRRDLEAVTPRVCTDDLAEQGLDPGESRAETLEWGGAVVLDGRVEVLLSGLYEVRGAAGSEAVSDPVEIRVVSEGDLSMESGTWKVESGE